MNIRIPQSGKAAKLAKAFLASQGHDIPHQVLLELVARLHGYADWQTMQADVRFDEKPGLKPLASNEYEFTGGSGDAITVQLKAISVYVKHDDEGVSVELQRRARTEAYEESLACTHALFSEAEPDVESNHRYIGRDSEGGWYWSMKATPALLPTPQLVAQSYGSYELNGPFDNLDALLDALEAEASQGEIETNWCDPNAGGDAFYQVFQDGAAYDAPEESISRAVLIARNLRDSGAGGCWTVRSGLRMERLVALYV